MNEKQTQEFQELKNLEEAGSLDDTQKSRLEELTFFQGLVEKTAVSEKKSKDFESAMAQKDHYRSKFEAEEKARKELETKLNSSRTGGEGLKVEDFIDISASLEGLDTKEKERISREHKLTGKPLSEIRKDEDFLLWQSAYRQKAEKEKANILPSSKQPNSDEPISLDDALNQATTDAEKEKILTEAGLYKEGKRRSDTVIIRGI